MTFNKPTLIKTVSETTFDAATTYHNLRPADMASVAASSSILLRGGTLLFHDDKDHVKPLRNTDILIQANRIAKIGKSLVAPAGTELVNCSGKIISPGFVDTHHHLWQTQLKGCHAEQSVFDYLVTGFWQSYAYKPRDMFWGQLGGALEAIDAGTTFVLDHAHGNQTNEHGKSHDQFCRGQC